MMTTNKKYKVNIFDTLNNISKKDISFYDQLTEDQRKGLQPLVVMRWLSGTSNARQIFFLNELVNTKIFPLYKHDKLLYQLMTICTTGRGQRYHWNKTTSKKTSQTPTVDKVIRQYFHYSSIEAAQVRSLLSNEDILQYADEIGLQSDDTKKLKKELKARG